MEEYEGKISGIGNATERKNEITADDLATLRNFIVNWEYGIINREGYNFNVRQDGNNVILEKGIMFAYGYFSCLPEVITIPFIKTSATQYRFIYAEMDKSTIPNTFKIKVKNNQSSDKIKPTTFRQDYLTAIRTGVFQLPLYTIKLDKSGIVEIIDLRQELDLLKNNIKEVEQSFVADTVIGTIESDVTKSTPAINTNDKTIATTEFVDKVVSNYIKGN